MKAAAASLLFLVTCGTLRAAEPPSRDPANLSIRNEVGEAIDKALGWLRTQQQPEGSWAGAEDPAGTALPLLAALENPRPPVDRSVAADSVQRGVSYLRQQVKPDGAFRGQGSPWWNTSLCLAVLAKARQPEDATLIAKAVTFLTHTPPANPGRRPTLTEMQAIMLALSMAAHGSRPEQGRFGLAPNFATPCQFTSGADAGGFAEEPVSDKVSDRKQVATCSATCAGLLLSLKAGKESDEPQVARGLSWLRSHFTFGPTADESRETYDQRLWLWSQTMAATEPRSASGHRDQLKELALKLINTQAPDGSWPASERQADHLTNAGTSTSYATLALETLWSQL